MDPHTNSQKLNSGDLAILTTSFQHAETEDKEILATVYRANKGIEVQNGISTTDRKSSKSRVEDIRNLLEVLEKLRKKAEESFRKSLPKKQKSIRNLKEADEEEKYPMPIIIQSTKPIICESLESFFGIPKGAALVGCLLPSPVATVSLPLSIGAIALTGSTVSAIRPRKKDREGPDKVINLLDAESRRQVQKQFTFQTAIWMILLIGAYFIEFEEARAKKTKTSSSYHPQCGCHCSSFQHRCYTIFLSA